jgi:alanyl-tRNA synthetase
MGILARTESRAQIEAFQRTVASWNKAETAKLASVGLRSLEEDIAKVPKGGVVVLRTTFGSDSKSIKKAMGMMKAAGVTALCCSEEAGGRFTAFAFVPSDASSASSIRADDWVAAALAPCGGRGGGSAESAQGQATSGIDDALKEARAFVARFL